MPGAIAGPVSVMSPHGDPCEPRLHQTPLLPLRGSFFLLRIRRRMLYAATSETRTKRASFMDL